jgi:ABC-type thiamin/hydroxymethylpyrimidine transport system permease subunit
MTNSNIIAAAALIAEIDPALARAFVAQPFNRSTLVTAFHKALSNSATFAGMADEIAMRLRSAIDSTRTTEAA